MTGPQLARAPDEPAASPASAVERFLDDAERALLSSSIESQRAEWVYETYISPDTAELTTQAKVRLNQLTADILQRAAGFRTAPLAPGPRRRLELIVLARSEVPPADPVLSEELSRIAAELRGHYGEAKCRLPGGEQTLDLNAIRQVFTSSRDPELLRAVWVGWHDTAAPVKGQYARFVELANRGAREMGFADTGEMWRSKYDMSAAGFRDEVQRLWEQVEPLYRLVHAFVRRRLRKYYGPAEVPASGAIPAHLLGELWAQVWDPILPVIAPPSLGSPFDLTAALRDRRTTPRGMVEYGERFFRSLGFDPLPPTFWERSMLTRPLDREVLCHASAWDVDFDRDVRLKMCLDITADDFHVVHHELGHTYYQLAYREQPFLYREGANDGFHEAIGDAVSLSVTPAYLRSIGLDESEPPATTNSTLDLLGRALDRVAFLPSAVAIDAWRWEVFSGSVGPEDYSAAWWRLRRRYGGIVPPVPRDENSFDPGAKMHVSCNVPYIRYFLARILQFQFHRAFARVANHRGPLHEFSVYAHREVGERFRDMLRWGASRPWPEALELLTGEKRMDGGALLEYFAPLEPWLRQETEGEPLGW